MLEYGRIDISEGVDVNEINLLKECEICQKKQRLKEYQKNYCKAAKSQYNNE